MEKRSMYLGDLEMVQEAEKVKGEFVRLEDDVYYKISHYDLMSPFFMMLVSSSDHWLFISSSGGLSAGRRNPANALFPYYTDDKITESSEHTGSKTILRVFRAGKWQLWEPFSQHCSGLYSITRNLYKNRIGNKLVFEEINEDLHLQFSYKWTFSENYGFVKISEIKDLSGEEVHVDVLDGIQNILPAGVDPDLQNVRSTLVDAYKKNELEKETGLGIFSLSSMIVDRAEPSESLAATTVWSRGLVQPTYLLSNDQLQRFREGYKLEQEDFIKAQKACFFVGAELSLAGNECLDWMIVSEVSQSSAEVENLLQDLRTASDMEVKVRKSIHEGTIGIKRLVGLADGLQKGADILSTGRHFSNVLFNIMRGGIFEEIYHIDHADLVDYVRSVNRKVLKQNDSFFNRIKDKDLNIMSLMSEVRNSLKPNLQRICAEYLPLSFSRRHGDPSRPWNTFNIEMKGPNGKRLHNYEGNWRDIFQNWEALSYAFPHFIEGMITKFLNASTIDGYNPYRITREGIDWEVIEPDDPWSYIGYWGDHQVIYLLKLLEHAENHFPGMLAEMLSQDNFVYANVPYRIRSYTTIRSNPNDTIEFMTDKAAEIDQRVKRYGSDGKLVMGRDGSILHVNMCEKLLVMGLAKLYNFIPEGGIWMNTQRPEWNDANNALVGNGLSMVTLNYLRRFLVFARGIFAQRSETQFELRRSVAHLLKLVEHTFQRFENGELNTEPKLLREFIDELGFAGEEYRVHTYRTPDEHRERVSAQRIVEFFDLCIRIIDPTLERGRREDGLFHAYNLLVFGEHDAHVRPLYEMLEGQVAAISSGLFPGSEIVNTLDALKNSLLFRADQYSYLLYPDRALPAFIEKNTLTDKDINSTPLIAKLLEEGGFGILDQDEHGRVHFAKDVHNAYVLRHKLEALSAYGLSGLVEAEGENLVAVYEGIFDHLSFTGRSGTFYGYEGLGCIYWHMVSKLLVSVQEAIIRAIEAEEEDEVINRLKDHYYEIRAGIGINKSPDLYGAFPTDAYSHTPGNAGVQQPGMTGQVKEDILNRWAELGILIREGRIRLEPRIFSSDELLKKDIKFQYIDARGIWQEVSLKSGEFAFTYCGVLFRYRKSDRIRMTIQAGGKILNDLDHSTIEFDIAQKIFDRSGEIEVVDLEYPFH